MDKAQAKSQEAQLSVKDKLRAWLREHSTGVNWFMSLLSAGLMAWAAVQWLNRASALRNACGTTDIPAVFCGEVPAYLQTFQFVVAVLGIATAIVAAALSLSQAILGRDLHIMRYAVGLVLATAILWVAAYWFGRIFYLRNIPPLLPRTLGVAAVLAIATAVIRFRQASAEPATS